MENKQLKAAEAQIASEAKQLEAQPKNRRVQGLFRINMINKYKKEKAMVNAELNTPTDTLHNAYFPIL